MNISNKFKKKNIVIVFVIVVFFILLFPFRTQLKDGGTVEYRAVLYKISKVHSLISIEEMENKGKIKPYNDGFIIEVLGFQVYNDVK